MMSRIPTTEIQAPSFWTNRIFHLCREGMQPEAAER
jgi:hypothetical protein